MNARQLLDPKGFARENAKKKKLARSAGAKDPQQNQTQPPPGMGTVDPRMLSNSRAVMSNAMKSNGSSMAIPSTSNGHLSSAPSADNSGSERGMTSFIENLHNVTTRDSAPSPKRKTPTGEDDEQTDGRGQKKVKSSFSGMGNGGMLNEDMKEQRQKHAAISSRMSQAIDLTNEPDDEVQVIKENLNDNEEICLGVIQAKATMSQLPMVSAHSLNGLTNGNFPRTKMSVHRQKALHNQINLLDRQSNKCGYLDVKAGKVLSPLLDGSQVNKLRMVVYLNGHPRKDGITKPGTPISEILDVQCILYAPRGKSERIGTWLANKQLFLSAPVTHAGKEYVNPQEPSRSRKVAGSNYAGGVQRTLEETKRDVYSIFDSLVGHNDLMEMEPNEAFIATRLMSHQKQALRFMTDHERSGQQSESVDDVSLWKFQQTLQGRDSWYNVITGHVVTEQPEPPRGGILADMMGLGKTLSILALTAATRIEAAQFAKDPVVPVDGGLVECNVKGTLIICPKSVMANWTEQIQAHAKVGKFRVYLYHGSDRTKDVEKLSKYDIVLTTYNTAASDSRNKDRTLSRIQWFRVVLDEAHQIRTQSSLVSQACCALEAQRRWAVTGTPVQNNLNDLGALVKFLRIRPFDEERMWAQYINTPFKNADPEVVPKLRLLVHSITLRRQKDKINLTERVVEHKYLEFTPAEQLIYAKVASDSYKSFMGMTGASMQLKGRSYAWVLKRLLQLRMLCAHGIEMLSEEHRREIIASLENDNAPLDLGDEPGLDSYEFITEKQAYEWIHMTIEGDADYCAHCGEKVSDRETEISAEGEDGEDSPTDEESEAEDKLGSLTTCMCLVCPDCHDDHISQAYPKLSSDERYECSYCHAWTPWGLFDLYRSTLREQLEAREKAVKRGKTNEWDEHNYSGPHTKVKALLQDLQASAEETAALPPGAPPIRSVVFSGWTTYLDLIGLALENNDFHFVRLDGSMSVKARTAVLETFKTDPKVTVLLVSIKAGGQGLNLTAANKVYMMEPQWNPGVELQAMDRVHRMGQKRDVKITHYIMKESVELTIQKIQKRKLDLADLSMKKPTKSEEQRERMEELSALFNGGGKGN